GGAWRRPRGESRGPAGWGGGSPPRRPGRPGRAAPGGGGARVPWGWRAPAASRSATVSFSITTTRSGGPADLASANRLLLPPISARRLVRIAVTPIDNHLLPNGLPRGQAAIAVFPCCSCSIRARQAEGVVCRLG